MSPRRIISVFGPVAAISGVAVALGCGCVSWTTDAQGPAAFVSRGLSEAYGISLSLKGRTEVSLLPLPRLGFRDVRLDAEGPDGGTLVEGTNLSLQLSLTDLLFGRVEVVSLALDGGTLSLPTGKDDRRWSGPVRRLAERVSAEDPDHPRRITLTRLTVTGQDPRDGSALTAIDVDTTLSWPLWSDELAIAGGFTWQGASARFALTGLHPTGLASGGESPFAASLSWPAGTLSADGRGSLADGLKLDGQTNLRITSVPQTVTWLGSDLALSPLIDAIDLDGRFACDRSGVRLPSLKVIAGGTVLEGAASAEMTGRRPSITATLAGDSLNVGPVLAGLFSLSGLEGAQEGWGRHPIALAPLLGGDLDLRLSGSSARVGPMLLEDVAANVMVRAGGIDASLIRATLQGGTLKGQLALRSPEDGASGETEVKAQGNFAGIDLGALLVEAGESGWLVGAGQGVFALEGKGRDAQELVGRVGGRVSLTMKDSSITGLDLADVLQRGTVAPGALARRNGRTSFERATLTLTFADGIGTFTEGALSARTLAAGLRGQISLPERTFTARAELVAHAVAGEAANPRVALFEIAGPWNAIGVEAISRFGGELSAMPHRPAMAVPTLPAGASAYAP